jgi:Tol biopolymer transport system component
VIGSVLLCALITGGVVYARRNTVSDSWCLLVTENGQPYELLEVDTGFRAPYRNVRPRLHRLDTQMSSSDGKYIASLRQDDPRSPKYSLYIEDSTTRTVIARRENIADTSLETLPRPFVDIAWSPDAKFLTFLWLDGVGVNSFVEILKPDGSVVHREADVTRSIGWSGDSRYFAYTRGGGAGTYQNTALSVWSASDSRSKEFARPGYQIAHAVWSPRENRIGFVQTDDATVAAANDWLVIASPDDGVEVTRDLGSIDNPDMALPHWSPDGRYVQLTYLAQGRYLLAITGTNGTNYPSIATSLKIYGPTWADGGNALLYEVERADSQFDWVKFHLDEKREEIILSGIDNFHVGGSSNGTPRLAVSWWKDDRGNVDLVNSDGTQRVSIVREATGIFGRSWSPDGSRIAVVWDSSADHTTRAHLTLANADGTGQHTFDIDGEPLSGLSWSNDSRGLVYISVDTERNQSLLLVTADGSQKRLIEKEQLITLLTGPDGSRFNVLWQEANGAQWIDGFDPAGGRMYRFQIGGGSLFMWSLAPNNQLAAIMTVQPNNSSLTDFRFSSSDGQSTKEIRSGVVEFINPTWSPDSNLFAFMQSHPNTTRSLQIVAADGTDVRAFPIMLPPGATTTWTRCD